MKILFTCGGTGGHINPALAVADYIMARHPEAELRFAGNPSGMEARLVPQAGYSFSPIVIEGFYRSLSISAMTHNFSAVCHALTAFGKVKRILDAFEPDLVMGTGGYVSGPVLRAAAKLGVPTVTHESNAFPGVTTKLLCKYVNRVLLAVPEAQSYLKGKCPFVVTGNPVRESFVFADRARARRELGIPPGCFVLLTFGGSLGAQRINETVADLIRWHSPSGRIHHIHAVGRYGASALQELLHERGVDLERLSCMDVREYIDDMPRCLAASDIVVCRAGSMTLSELEAVGRASILIPSPNVAENHQYHNAMALANRGAAIVVEEKNLTGDWLCKTVEELMNDSARLQALSRNAAAMAIPDATARIYVEMMKMF